MFIETKDLMGAPLRYAVAIAEGATVRPHGRHHNGWLIQWPGADDWDWFDHYRPDTDRQADDIIDRERIGTMGDVPTEWTALHPLSLNTVQHGPTRRVAALRCWVCRRLGTVVDVPPDLVHIPDYLGDLATPGS